ncbi:DMT family transporter [Aurantimicrobium minutum]|uniref:DMT family transporter n=1 Tax=Aurantimicrobium minutum TaxID=708131 RepID=UPI00248DB8CE|nr:DMT family transporter [Aurantimicrobium minutum]
MTTSATNFKRGQSPALIAFKFVALALLWGSSFFFIKIALDTLSWGQVAWARVVAGGIFMLVFWLISREKLPKDIKLWGHITVAGIIGIGIPFIFFPWAEQYITSAVATIYNGLTPIMTAIIAVYVLRVENFNRNQAVGVLVGLAGLVVVIAPWTITDLGGSFWGQIAALSAAVMYGFSGTYLKKYVFPSGVSAKAISIIEVGAAALFILLLTPFLATGTVTIDWSTVIAISIIGFGGTGLAYLWFNDVLESWGPTRASSVTYVMPIVGIMLGVVFLGETLHWYEPVGGAIVIAGVLIMRRQAQK